MAERAPLHRAPLEVAERAAMDVQAAVKSALPPGWDGWAILLVAPGDPVVVYVHTNLDGVSLAAVARSVAEKRGGASA